MNKTKFSELYCSKLLLGCLSTAAILVGCYGQSGQAARGASQIKHLDSFVKQSSDLVGVSYVLIAPIFTDVGVGSKLDSGVRGQLTSELLTAFNSEAGIEAKAAAEFVKAEVTPATLYDLLFPAARQEKANAVLVTDLHEYLERQGSQVGATRGAEIGFTMRLLRVTDNREVWSTHYHFKDRAVTDNILNMSDRQEGGGGFGWKRADQVAAAAFSAAARDLGEKRSAQFVALKKRS